MKGSKIVATIFFVFLLLIILGMTALATFVSPNRFKPLVIEQVKKYTGRDLIIDGDLSWTLFPTLGVKIGHLQLNNTPDFKQKTFAEMDSATVSVKLLPLLHSRIESSGVTLKGLKLNLIKNINGKTNWADLQKTPSAAADKTATEETTAASPKRAAFGLAISGVDISDATVHWENEKAKQTFDLDKFELHLKEITLSKPVPIKTAFNFVGNNPNVKGQLALTGEISLNLEKQLYALHNINLTTKLIQDAKNFDINLKGDADIDMEKQHLQLDNLQAQIANLKLTGKVDVSHLSGAPITAGHLSVQPFDVKKWLKDTGQDVAAIDVLNNLSGEFDFTAGTSLPSVNVKGDVKVSEVKASKLTITNIDVKTLFQKGVLDLSPMTANFYQGNLTGSTKVNLNTAVPQISVNAKLANVQAEPLMNDLAHNDKVKIIGAGNVEAQITTSGTTGDVITKNLNGTVKISFNKGILQGFDVSYLFDRALSFAHKDTTSSTDTKQTEFGTLTATAAIHNGIVKNDDLKIDSPRFDTTGKGSINLVNSTINYNLQTQMKKTADQKNELANMYGLAIPIGVSGSLTDPQVTLDASTLMKAVAEQQMQKAKTEVRDKFKDKIKDKLPGAAGELLNNLLSN